MLEKFKTYLIILLLLTVGVLYGLWNRCVQNPVIVEKPVRIFETHPSPVPDIVLTPRDTTIKIVPKKKVSYGSSRTNYHRVKRGENLYRISLRYGTTVDRLKELNHLFTDEIKKGAWIYIGTEAERAILNDSIYTYSEYFGNDTLNATVHTQSLGKILNQSVDLYSKPIISYRSSLLGGVELSSNSSAPINLMLGYRTKNGLSIIGSTNLYNPDGKRFYSVGVLKDVRLKW